jgi:hypothetical protein
MNRLRSPVWLLGGVLVLPLAGGCSARGPVRHEITGRVTYKGEPVDDGIIEFEPLDNQGTKDGSSINNGEYRIPQGKGLLPGRYRVNVYIGDGTSGAGNASPDTPARRPGTKRGKERAPPEFNKESKQVREVTEGGPNRFDFDIP